MVLAFILFFQAPLQAAKPFENIQTPSRFSPYSILFNNTRSASPYQTLVRPLIENEKRFNESQLQLDQLARQQAIRPRLPPPRLTLAAPKRGVSQTMRITGHETRFQDGRRFSDHLHYFPQRAVR
jgi:hypothetical protein